MSPIVPNLPEPTIFGPLGREFPMRPRCFRCRATRLNYTSRDWLTGEEREHEEVIRTASMDPGCEHVWSDQVEPVADEARGEGL